LKLAARKGAAWLWGITDSFGRMLTVVAAFGVPTGVGFVQQLGLVGPVVGLGTVSLLALLEGSFQTWQQDHEELAKQQNYENSARGFRDACDRWVASVERLLDERAITRPPVYSSFNQSITEAHKQQNVADAYDRETVATYIATYRDEGAQRFDVLVKLGHIVDDSREVVRSPSTVAKVRDAADTIGLAASRIGSEGI
jgi:hypothetical protein